MIKPVDTQRRRTASAAKLTQMLREQIESGVYAPGEPLPAERALAVSLGANRRTVRAAVEQLASEGLLSIKPKCRPVVAAAIRTRTPRRTGMMSPTLDPRTRVAKVRPLANSQFVALIMWHGLTDQAGATPQQLIFWGMNKTLGKAGYHGVFLDLGDSIGSEEENATREAARLQYALDHEFGGVIFYAYAYRQNRELVREVARRMPVVLIDRMLTGIDTDFVGIDNRLSMHEATKHLIDLGHRRLAYVTRNEPINTVIERQEGFRTALREAFGDEADESILTAPPNLNMVNWPVFDALMQLPAEHRPTGIVCVNDYEASRIAERLSAINLTVPGDVSLVGFDNIVRTLPNGIGLTTVAQPFEEIGSAAATALLKRIDAPSAPSTYVELPTRIIARQSTSPPQ